MADTMLATFEKVKEHDERIQVLEEADLKHDERLKRLEDNAIKLENTVMSENRDTRQTMERSVNKLSDQNDDLFEIVKSAMGMKTTNDAQKHEFRMARWNTISTISLKLSGALLAALGSGGILYIAFQKFVE